MGEPEKGLPHPRSQQANRLPNPEKKVVAINTVRGSFGLVIGMRIVELMQGQHM